jgi:hypothetical protein
VYSRVLWADEVALNGDAQSADDHSGRRVRPVRGTSPSERWVEALSHEVESDAFYRICKRTGTFVHNGSMAVVILLDLAVQIGLLVKGQILFAIIFFLVGWVVTMYLAHWIGIILTSPFLFLGLRRHKKILREQPSMRPPDGG